ncbi:hypothetical protein [Streptomyces sp. BE147]|uniref:hypothetical protein n=1 Tax=unclassified Streptomyces TaxID=2593676 RepID=UPI002E7A4056|nr:hypothetical protein [Streptomyces sp. BE147]MEE1740199.1 hypothetical protein [Streptomyces sp. BE147]
MGTTDSGLQETTGPIALIRGFLAGGTTGAALAGMVSGVVLERVPLLLLGAGLQVVTVTVLLVVDSWIKARRGKPVTRTALALIEDLRAIGGESADVPVRFDLTVAPEDRPAYRVTTSQSVNLVDLPTYRPQGMTVVEYRPDEPWEVEIVTRPSPEWARRAETEKADSAPESSRVAAPVRSRAGCFGGLVGLLIGAAVVVLLFRGELFADDGSAGAKSSSSSSTTFSSSTTVSGPTSSMLDIGRMRETAESLTARVGTPTVADLSIDEHRMAVSGEAGGPQDGMHAIDLRTLPYELFPGLVREARNTLGVRDPGAWRIDVEPASGDRALTIRVSVTGGGAKASLEADAQGRITKRHPN